MARTSRYRLSSSISVIAYTLLVLELLKGFVTYKRIDDGKTSENVLEHGIIKHLHQTIAQSGEVPRYSENGTENESLIWTKLFRVFVIVLWIAVGFLKLKLAGMDHSFGSIIPERVFAQVYRYSGC